MLDLSDFTKKMHSVLLIGAGKSATSLIDYLLKICQIESWKLTVADASLDMAKKKIGQHKSGIAIQLDIIEEKERRLLIESADLVISMVPPHLHILIAKDCLLFHKNLLTASYIDHNIQELEKEITAKGLLFLYEMGLDPGIDHMSAMAIIHSIENEGGKIKKFISHCGGLVAPESDNNPWHYKISWNLRNIIQAGAAGALYRKDGEDYKVDYQHLFNEKNMVEVSGLPPLCWYANRDSLSYLKLYRLETCNTFLRTTLRDPAFCFGWNKLIALSLLSDDIKYNTQGMSIASFFRIHFQTLHLNELLQDYFKEKDGLFETQLIYLGYNDDETLLNIGMNVSALDIMQYIMERRLALKENDKDMIVMMHQFEYILKGQTYLKESYLIVKGNDKQHTAMAKTVGLPLGIAAVLILKDIITLTGLHIPVNENIYKPVLKELEQNGISFNEFTSAIP